MPAIALYLPLVATFTTFNQQTIKRYISNVGGDVKITVKFLEESSKDCKVTSENGTNKGAIEIPRRVIKAEILTIYYLTL